MSIELANPFDDPAIYGPTGEICISPEMSKVIVPFISQMGTEGTIHARGSSEAYILAASKHKKLKHYLDWELQNGSRKGGDHNQEYKKLDVGLDVCRD